jgi:hypothetical protein
MGVVVLVSWCLALPILLSFVLTPGIVLAVLSHDGLFRLNVGAGGTPLRRHLLTAAWALSCVALLSVTAGVLVVLFRTMT